MALWYTLEPLAMLLPPMHVEVNLQNAWTAVGVIGLIRVEMVLARRHH